MSFFLVHTDSDTGLDLVLLLKVLGKAVFCKTVWVSVFTVKFRQVNPAHR